MDRPRRGRHGARAEAVGVDIVGIGAQLIGGLLLLLVGGEALLRGGARLASVLGMPPVLIALTVMAFGSSAPELFVCLEAAYRGQDDPGQAALVLGNVLGSNLANFALVLGLAATLRTLPVDRRILRVEVPLLILLQLALVPVVIDGGVQRWEGCALFLMGVAYILFTIRVARRFRDRERALVEEMPGSEVVSSSKAGLTGSVTTTVMGLVLLPLGAQLLVRGGIDMGNLIGLSPRFVGLTATAIGTSLPEVVTAVLAVRKNELTVAAGTVFGSNVFNICYALALSAGIFPLTLPEEEVAHVLMDVGAALLITVYVSFICLRRAQVNRSQGLMLLMMYLVVLAYGYLTGRVS